MDQTLKKDQINKIQKLHQRDINLFLEWYLHLQTIIYQYLPNNKCLLLILK